MPYILNAKKLKKGDIILTTNDSRISLTIRQISNSKFSHVTLYLGNHSFMEADTNGVHFFSTQRFAFKDKSNISVRRLINSDSDLLDKIEINARKYSYRDYNINGVKNIYRDRLQVVNVSNILDVNDIQKWDKPLFCSQLIGVAFTMSGIDFKTNDSLDTFSPADIENSPVLEEITDFLIEISEEQASEYTIYEDEELPENALSKQTDVSQKILIELKKEYQLQNLPIPADLQDAIDSLQNLSKEEIQVADKIISVQLENTSFIKLWKENRRLHPYLYNPFDLIHNLNLGNIRDMNQASLLLTDLLASINETISFQTKNLNTTKQNFNVSKLKTYKLLITMYEEFIEDLKKASESIEMGLSPIKQIVEIVDKVNNI